ncbi:MAG: hypothetical protein FWB93_01105 [Oscillospiraceae bacterium]|nr:hypothetical protein [Oscillospiraceae bacterium]
MYLKKMKLITLQVCFLLFAVSLIAFSACNSIEETEYPYNDENGYNDNEDKEPEPAIEVHAFSFQSVTIELGEALYVTLQDFVIEKITEEHIELPFFVTDIEAVALTQVGETEIVISYREEEHIVLLSVQDTTSPIVQFQNVTVHKHDQVIPSSFIVSISDHSPTYVTMELVGEGNMSEIGVHTVDVTVTDAYGNATSKELTLTIEQWIVSEWTIELGNTLSAADLVHNAANYNRIPQAYINALPLNQVGAHTLSFAYNGVDYQIPITVQDTTPPTLTLRNMTIFYWQSIGMNDIVTTATDRSGVASLTMNPATIDTNRRGTQTVTVTAVDGFGNTISRSATVTINDDRRPPVITGATNITIDNGAGVNWLGGVSATDARTGAPVTVTVDYSAVVLNRAGATYATYSATDSRGNTSTVRRRITVRRGQPDIDHDFAVFFNNHLAGRDVLGVVSQVRRLVRHTSAWGRPDAIDHAMRNMSGNCYVKARVIQRALTQMGIRNYLIHTIAHCHYWNLVYMGGVWRHFDATPSRHSGCFCIGPLTDAQKLSCRAQNDRRWDVSRWPAAE